MKKLGRFGIAFVLGSMAMACGGADPDVRHGRNNPEPSTDAPTPAPNDDPASRPISPACPAQMTAPVSIALDDKVQDLAVVGENVYFRTSSGVSRMDKKGSGRAQIVNNENLAHAYADTAGLLLVQATPDGNGNLTVQLVRTDLDGKVQTTTAAPGFEPYDTRVFAADASDYYITTATTNGDALYRLGKQLPQLTQIANFGVALEDKISSPQLAGSAVWLVRGKTRVYNVAIEPTDPNVPKLPEGAGGVTEPKEVFGTGETECKLAVGQFAYCTDGKILVRRDLKGAAATTIFDTTKSAATAGFGTPFVAGDAIWMKPDTMNKGVIRAVKPSQDTAEEKVTACGRGEILSVAVDASAVVWSENGDAKGIWIVSR